MTNATMTPAPLDPDLTVTPDDHSLLHELRHARRRERKKPLAKKPKETKLTMGPWLADLVAATMGSWRFIGVQSTFLAIWIAANAAGWVSFDIYPFILLNLMLSFQAAYAAPFIMMSQNRQSEIDRSRAIDDYNINLKAELEIELLHQKIDMMKEQEIARLQSTIEDFIKKIAPKFASKE
jgi:uncharacterized membrane protein